ncbi:HAD-IA family hydrolase [Amycolatopsis sp. lyj-23]|uniref:HAD-IA family hydrolase n=1 Tax=Amycolatopsis sp. lyj-23 TaxID=2789283 RepID=UPI00397A9CE9
MESDVNVRRYTSRSGVTFHVVHEKDPGAGPANGGLRLLPYPDDAAALADGVRLTRRMMVKHALYRTGFSGAKITARADPATVDRVDLLHAVAEVLNSAAGDLYTGCDMNIGNADAQLLTELSPYVLAAVDAPVDANVATAHGVVACARAALGGRLSGRYFLVHGVGKTGSVVAALLAAAGAEVHTYDKDPARQAVPGCTALSSDAPWWRVPVDALVLCSASGLVNPTLAAELRCRAIISGANCPYSDDVVENILKSRGILSVPDALANAGAVICDSIEYRHPELFRSAVPDEVYRFVAETVTERTREYLALVERNPGGEVLSHLLAGAPPTVCGDRFAATSPATGPAAVLFDLDGTLITTEEVWNEAISEVLRGYGVAVPEALLRNTTGLDITTTLLVIADALHVSLPVELVAAAVESLVARRLSTVPLAVPGARELLADLAAAGVPTALVTSTRRELVDSVLPVLGHTFDVVVCADDVMATKPDPEPYTTALTALGVPAGRCVAIEDTVAGVTSAIRAGCAVVAVTAQPIDLATSSVTLLSEVRVEQLGAALRFHRQPSATSDAIPLPLPQGKTPSSPRGAAVTAEPQYQP